MNKLIVLSAAAVALTGSGNVMENPVKTPEIAPARDGNIAIKEELCAAREAGTVAAYDLFIARHPDHPLADAAREERSALMVRTQPKR